MLVRPLVITLAALGAMALGCQGELGPSGADYEIVPTQEDSTTTETASPASDPPSTPEVKEPPSNDEPVAGDSVRPADGGGDERAEPMDVGPQKYAGTLVMNTTKPFGGSGQCRFTVTMEDIHVALTVDGRKIVDAEVNADMIEKVVGTCGHPSIQTNTHEHVLDKNVEPQSISRDGPVELTMYRRSGAPATILVVSLAMKGESFEASLKWKRDDGQAPVLMWTTSAKVSVQKM